MKAHGVEIFKSKDLEIKMSSAPTEIKLSDTTITQPEAKVSPPSQAIPVVDIKIPHHVNEVANLLKLDDYALVDKLFPDYSQMTQDGA